MDCDVIGMFLFKGRPPSLKNAKPTTTRPLFLFRIYKRGPASVSVLPHRDPYRYSMASLAFDFDSPNFEYFPPTPSPSDDESEPKPKPTTEILPSMSSGAPNSLPATKPNGGSAPKPAKVTLHLGHLPSKKDIKGPWPRTPTRVSSSMLHIIFH